MTICLFCKILASFSPGIYNTCGDALGQWQMHGSARGKYLVAKLPYSSKLLPCMISLLLFPFFLSVSQEGGKLPTLTVEAQNHAA